MNLPVLISFDWPTEGSISFDQNLIRKDMLPLLILNPL